MFLIFFGYEQREIFISVSIIPVLAGKKNYRLNRLKKRMFIINQIFYQIIIISFNYFYIFYINFKNIFIFPVLTNLFSQEKNIKQINNLTSSWDWTKKKENNWNWIEVYLEKNQISGESYWLNINGWFYIFQSFFILVIFNILSIIVFNRFVYYFNYFKNHNYFKYFIYINLYFCFYFCSILFIFNNDLLFLFILLEIFNYFIYSNIAISIPSNKPLNSNNNINDKISLVLSKKGPVESIPIEQEEEKGTYIGWKLGEQIIKGAGSEKTIINIFYFVINSLISIIFLYDVYKFYINYNTFNISTIQLIQNFQTTNFFNILNSSNNNTLSLINNEIGENIRENGTKIINNKNQIICIMFKLAIAPFHFWFISLYKNISIFVTFFFNTLIKFLFYLFLFKLIQLYFITGENIYNNLIIIGSILSLIIGSIGGLKNNKLLHIILNSNIFNSGFLFVFFYFYYCENWEYFFEYLIVYILLTVQIFLLYIYYMLIPFNTTHLNNLPINPVYLEKEKFIENNSLLLGGKKLYKLVWNKNAKWNKDKEQPLLSKKTQLKTGNNLKGWEMNKEWIETSTKIKRYILLMLVLSFIGIPPLSGFFIKFNLFSLIMENFNNYYYYWFGISIITILIACSFYFKIFLFLFLNSGKPIKLFHNLIPSGTQFPSPSVGGGSWALKIDPSYQSITFSPSEIELEKESLNIESVKSLNVSLPVSFVPGDPVGINSKKYTNLEHKEWEVTNESWGKEQSNWISSPLLAPADKLGVKWKLNNWKDYYYSVSFIINLIFLLNVFYILYIPMIYPLLNILN